MTEIIFWADIPGYENYMISRCGKVWSKKSNKLLSPADNGTGYLYVQLCSNGKIKNFTVHRLVLRCFVGECPKGFESDHINRNRKDNRIDNLRYCSRSTNQLNKFTKGSLSFSKQRKSPWIVSFQINYKKKSKSFKTKEEAQRFRLEYQKIIN